ncbi:MAG: hypothetical protein Q4A32_03490 [Lachnospiraceae bacterium]|nr:hypothetical protein [Lachnospiraceae bacterium]
MGNRVTIEEAKKRILGEIISAQIGTYMSTYAPDDGVITISNLIKLIDGLTKYRARQALKSLMADGLIACTSQGRPAIVSYGEYTELVCESGPPINGYKLTAKGYESKEYQVAYKEWCKSMEEWGNSGRHGTDDD